MQLSVAVQKKSLTENAAMAVLDVIETFLVRRATCGHEPTGLHAVFKKLWADCSGDISAPRVAKEIAKHKTVAWPTETEFGNAIAQRPLYGVNITAFLVLEYNRSLKGDTPGIASWLEHVLPDNPESSWFDIFTKESHAQAKDRLANLLPLSAQMNMALSNKPYAQKRSVYQEDSGFKSTRQFAETYEEWTPKKLEERSSILKEWAIKRWPHERPD
jgi:hypothetical protein